MVHSGVVAGCGGLLRDHNGTRISRFLGSGSAVTAELWGTLEGIRLAASHGFAGVELHVDSTA